MPTPPAVVAITLPQVHALAAATVQPPGAPVVAGAAPVIEKAAHVEAHECVAVSAGSTAGRVSVEREPLLALVVGCTSRPATQVHRPSASTVTIAIAVLAATTSRILQQKPAASAFNYHTVIRFFHESWLTITAGARCRSDGGYRHT